MFTVTALPTQDQKTDQRDIFIPADRFFAIRTTRTRTNNGKFAGDTINKNIQKTANNSTKNEDRNRIKNLQCINSFLLGHNTPQMNQNIYRLNPYFL